MIAPKNPVWDGYLADPFVFTHDGVHYAVGTGGLGSADAASALTSPGAIAEDALVLPVVRSRDFVHWALVGEALGEPARSRGPEVWAPAVAFEGGTFYLYYSVGAPHTLRVATSKTPEGPYADVGPLMEPVTTPFAIDPHPFRDDDGTWWLFYARDFLDRDGGAHPGTALVVDRLATMTRLAGEERTVLRARHPWTLFQAERAMYGRVFDWHTLEGPCVVRHEGRYYCLYSGACYGNVSYGVDYAVADHVLGPWSDAGAEHGPRVLFTVPGEVLGPGHCSHVVGPDGGEWLAYHAWDAEGRVRRMCLDRLVWTPDGPRCAVTESVGRGSRAR